MGAVFLSLHVLAAVLFIGPVTVAVSLFPRYARQALAPGRPPGPAAVAAALHRVSRVYAVLGLSVPVAGVATAVQLGVLGNAWVLTSILVTLLAAGVLGAVVLPAQSRLADRLAQPSAPGAPAAPEAAGQQGSAGADLRRTTARMSAASGVFALLWTVVVVLMIVRPGSTTGV